MQDPTVQHRYINNYKGQCYQHKIFTRAKALWEQITPGQPLNPQQQLEYEEIDTLKTQTMHWAKRKCQKLKMGAVEWSPQLALSRVLIAMWTAMVRRLMNKAGYTATSGITLTMAKNNLKAETKKYYQIKRQASTHHETFLESLAQAEATAKKVDKVKHLKTL